MSVDKRKMPLLDVGVSVSVNDQTDLAFSRWFIKHLEAITNRDLHGATKLAFVAGTQHGLALCKQIANETLTMGPS